MPGATKLEEKVAQVLEDVERNIETAREAMQSRTANPRYSLPLQFRIFYLLGYRDALKEVIREVNKDGER